MIADVLGPAVIYLLIGLFVGFILRIELLDDAEWCPKDTELAVAVLCGVLWPLVIAAAIGLGLLLVTCAIARSFAALWRAMRPPQLRVPRAACHGAEVWS